MLPCITTRRLMSEAPERPKGMLQQWIRKWRRKCRSSKDDIIFLFYFRQLSYSTRPVKCGFSAVYFAQNGNLQHSASNQLCCSTAGVSYQCSSDKELIKLWLSSVIRLVPCCHCKRKPEPEITNHQRRCHPAEKIFLMHQTQAAISSYPPTD